ncbi:MAG: preprotein translocase subunit YajC [Clostridia bacterium]|nr:preprotein translocase subunit YajC [Clostridia bacterium]
MNLLASSGVGTYILLGVFVVAIIGLMVWQNISNKKRAKEAQEMVNNIKIGDRVKTIGGICGFVAEVNDAENTFVLETGMEGKKSYVKFDKAAIYQTAPANGTQAVEEVVKEEVKEEKVEEAPVEVATEEKPAPKKRTTKKKAE